MATATAHPQKGSDAASLTERRIRKRAVAKVYVSCVCLSFDHPSLPCFRHNPWSVSCFRHRNSFRMLGRLAQKLKIWSGKVHKATSPTSHHLVPPPGPNRDGPAAPNTAWEAFYLRGSVNPTNSIFNPWWLLILSLRTPWIPSRPKKRERSPVQLLGDVRRGLGLRQRW